MSNLESIPGQTGYLILTADGAIQQSAGDLQNDEETAAIVLHMVQSSGKLMSALNSEGRGSFQRLSIVYRHHTLVASVWSQRVHVVKRINKET
ncbi:ragulator complex protein LAMTOR4 homolog [Halichondria panicea]|uniref:ragulator complex protein LAMTOR4 homolog n=1 Tax=Halichondria panicea TaxID=6063 RepID=UPI00312BC713